MRPTLAVSVLLILVGAGSCLAIERRRHEEAAAPASELAAVEVSPA